MGFLSPPLASSSSCCTYDVRLERYSWECLVQKAEALPTTNPSAAAEREFDFPGRFELMKYITNESKNKHFFVDIHTYIRTYEYVRTYTPSCTLSLSSKSGYVPIRYVCARHFD